MSQAWPVSTATITDFPGGTADVADGSIATEMSFGCHVRFTPVSDRTADIPDWQLCATTRLMHRSNSVGILEASQSGTSMATDLAASRKPPRLPGNGGGYCEDFDTSLQRG